MALDWSTDGRDWPHGEYSRFVDVGPDRWHVQRMGEGAGILLLHGTGAATHSWDGLAPRLADQFDVLAMDLPGHGFTRMRRGFRPRLDQVGQAISELLAAEGFEPKIIIGHSAGAAIAMSMVLDRRVSPSRIISLNGALRPFEGAAGHMFPAMAKLMHYNPLTARMFAWSARDRARVEKLIRQTGSDVRDRQIEFYVRLMRDTDHVAGALAMMAFWDLAGLTKRVPDVNVPCLFLSGRQDRAVPPEDVKWLADAVNQGDFAILEGLGHLAHEEAPDRVLEAMVAKNAL